MLSGCSAPPQILSLNPANGSTSVVADAPLRVVFDHPMDEASVVSRLHVDPGLPGCDLQRADRSSGPCRLRWAADGSSFILEHTGALFAPSTRYTFHLDPGVRDREGEVNSLDHKWDYTTAPAPRVTSTTPADAQVLPADAPVVVAFSETMNPRTTAAAITLRPPVPGTRVVRNLRDTTRFVLLPGRLLDPGTQYTLAVAPSATDIHGQVLDPTLPPVRVAFTAGPPTTAGHVLVVARHAGGGPSSLLLARLEPAAPGEPIPAATVLTAPLCAHPACGEVHTAGPVEEFLSANLSPDGTEAAVVAASLADPSAPTRAFLLHLPSGAQTDLPAGSRDPSWAPDGRLCLVEPDGVHILGVDGSDTRLPGGRPVTDPALWAPDGSSLALPVRGAGGAPGIDLVDPALGARYPLPGLTGALQAAAFSPDSRLLAVRADTAAGGATWLLGLRGGDPRPRRLADDLTPIGFVDAATLLAVSRPDDGSEPALVRIGVDSGERTALSSGPDAGDTSTVALAPDGRTLAYLGADPRGGVQAWIENADGSNPLPLTAFAPGGDEATAVDFGG